MPLLLPTLFTSNFAFLNPTEQVQQDKSLSMFDLDPTRWSQGGRQESVMPPSKPHEDDSQQKLCLSGHFLVTFLMGSLYLSARTLTQIKYLYQIIHAMINMQGTKGIFLPSKSASGADLSFISKRISWRYSPAKSFIWRVPMSGVSLATCT